MKTVVVLAMHGSPPNDFPRGEIGEFFALHARHEAQNLTNPDRYLELSDKLKLWPRTPKNDPFHAASCELAQVLGQHLGYDVRVGFNEFCAPDIDEALAQAVGDGAGRVIIATTMMIRGGEHAEREIAQAVSRGRHKYPEVEFIYAWPFETAEVACFLAEHVKRFLG